MTGRGHAPLGPVGHVDVDAHEGKLIPDDRQAQRLLTNAKSLADSLSRPDDHEQTWGRDNAADAIGLEEVCRCRIVSPSPQG